MAGVDGGNMVYRLSRLIGAAAIGLALIRLGSVIQPSEAGTPWQFVVLGAAVLGGGITWLAVAYRAPAWLVIVANAIGLALLVTRAGAPETALFGLLPSGATFQATSAELSVGMELVRYASPPLVPVAGVVVLLVVVFWIMGALLVWATSVGRPLLGLVPPILLGLQLATVDRNPTQTVWLIAGIAVLAASLAAMAFDERWAGSGRLRRPNGDTAPSGQPGLLLGFSAAVALAALIGVGALAGHVPVEGNLDWRTRGPLGGGLFGGVSYNLFAGIRQTLVEQTEVPLFRAAVSGGLPGDQLYWRLITLDVFDGRQWLPSNAGLRHPGDGEPFEDASQVFQGRTTLVEQAVVIDNLRQSYLPVLYAPMALASDEELLRRSFQVRPDGSVRYDVLSRPGLAYRVSSVVPTPSLGDLATVDGELSPVFAGAAAAGEFEGGPAFGAEPVRPASVDSYLQLPEIDARIIRAARDLTAGASTAFERGVLLEEFFRDGGLFTYTTDIEPGHSASDLADWLFTEDSANYRRGYCEQFATAMAVMARAAGVPSRVVLGFTPGDSDESGVITVRQKHAHAWVELWVDGQGWVRFDPTPRADGVNPATTAGLGFEPRQYLPEPDEVEPGLAGGLPPAGLSLEELLRRAGELDPSSLEGAPLPSTAGSIGVPRWLLVAGAVVAAAGVIPAVKVIRRRRRMRRLDDGDVTAAWEQIVTRLGDLDEAVPANLTPLEVATSVGSTLRPLAEVYTARLYGPDPAVGPADLSRATDSLHRTEQALRARHTRWQRLLGWMRPRL
jgi:transglutaminase-like putative cysteine protease